MMAGIGDDMGGFKGLQGDAQLSSHQDLTQVGADSGGTKIDFVDCKGVGNVGDDVGGSCVFVGEGDGGDPGGDVNCNVEVKDGGVVEVESGGVVVGIGGNDEVGESDCGLLAVMDKGGALHGGLLVKSGSVGVVGDGQRDCEVKGEDQVGLKDESGVGVENGQVVVGAGEDDREVNVENQVGLKDESGVEVENGEVVVGAGEDDCEVKFENQAGLKDESGVKVENGEIVVSAGEDDREVKVENQAGLKDESGVEVENGEVVVSAGEDDCVVKVENQAGLKDESGVEFENGEVVVSAGEDDREVKVEDQVGLKDDREVKVKHQADLKHETVAGVGNGEVVVGAGGIDQDYAVEENNLGLSVEDVEDGQPAWVKVEDQVDFESTIMPIENRESQTDTVTEFGERQAEVIELVVVPELSENSVKPVEQNVVLSSAELGENETSEAVVLGADGCELAKVVGGIEDDVGEGQIKQIEIKLVEESLAPQISVTSSVDGVSHELGEDQAKLKQINDLANDTEPGESKEAVIKSAEDGELSDITARASQQELIVSPADFGQEYDTVVLDADGRELAKVEAVIEVAVVDKKSEEQTELESVEDSLRSQIRITESVDCLSHELEEESNKLKKKKDYKVSRECIDKSQSVNELDSTSGTICSVEKMPTKCCESIISDTADGAPLELEASGCVIFKGNDTVNLANLESDKSQMSVELSGNVPTEICGSYLASIDAGTVSDQVPEDADCGVGLVQGCKAEGVVQVTNGDGTMTTETSTLQTNLEEQIGGGAISPELNGTPDDAESNCMLMQAQSDGSFQSDSNGGAVVTKCGNLVCPVTENKSEMEAKNLDTEDMESEVLSATTETKLETEGSNGLSSCHPTDAVSGMKIEFGTFDSAELLSKSGGVDVPSIYQISNGDIENSWKADSTINSVGFESCADMNFISGVQYCSDMAAKDATVVESKVPSGSVDVGPAFFLECSSGDSVNGQNLGVEAKAKPFQFLVKFPRYDDDKLRERIKDAQLLVEEKTIRRDDIRREIEMKRAKLQSINHKYETTKLDERAARRLVKLKRQEIDSIQDGMNRVKNSISVIDITNRIAHMEHMIEHETNPLNEEKQLLREINTMRKLRDQISSNVCPLEEVNLACSQIEPMETQLKTLKKELGDLKAKVSNAEAAVILIGKEYNGESKSLRELQAQFRAANDVRQDAYKDLSGLKKQLHDKTKHYWMYKDELKVANDFAIAGDREALYRLCANQVEAFMDLWNKNDEFREDYVRCNMRSTLRRLRTLDGRSLGPDEEAPAIPIFVGEREDMQLSTPSRAKKQVEPKNTVKTVKGEQVDGESLEVAEPENKMLKEKTSVKPISGTGSVLHIVSGHLESVETKEEEKQKTEEELELSRQAEMLKVEIAAKLKEKLRQEERVKAQEALERKKRNAEKAQMRAMLRAQKEAEQKEKEREKRLRKKEKKNADGETGLELQTDSTKEKEESTDSLGTKLKKTSQVNKYIKPKAAAIPPALRNRGKRRLKQVMWWILGGLAIVLFVFMVVNSGSYRHHVPRSKGDRFSGSHRQPV